MLRLSITLSALLFSQYTFAALNPVGLWKTINEETNEAKSLVRISEQNGVLTGKVEKILNQQSRMLSVKSVMVIRKINQFLA